MAASNKKNNTNTLYGIATTQNWGMSPPFCMFVYWKDHTNETGWNNKATRMCWMSESTMLKMVINKVLKKVMDNDWDAVFIITIEFATQTSDTLAIKQKHMARIFDSGLELTNNFPWHRLHVLFVLTKHKSSFKTTVHYASMGGSHA